MEVLLSLKNGERDPLANKMVQRFKETCHPVFKNSQCLQSWDLETEEG